MSATVETAMDLMDIKSFVAKYPAFTESWLRKLIFNKEENGFDKVIIQASRKILIDVNAFFEWLEENRFNGSKRK